MSVIFRTRLEETIRHWSNPSWWNLLILTPWWLGAAFFIYQSSQDRAVAKRQESTTGIITSHEPHNHNSYGYSFYVNGKSYTGSETPLKDDLQIGLKVRVYYDPIDPATSALTDFDELALNQSGPVPFILLGTGSLALFIYYRRHKMRSARR